MRNIILAGFLSVLVFCGFETYARPCERCHGVCCESSEHKNTLDETIELPETNEGSIEKVF